MVAVTIISVIFVLVSSFIWLAFKTSTRSKEISLRYVGIRNVFEIITQEIHSATAFDHPSGEDNFMVAEGKVISFWSLPPFYVKEGREVSTSYENLYRAPIFKVSYESKKKGEEVILYKKIQSPFEDKVVEFPMCKGKFEFSVLYYDKESKQLVESDEYSGQELPVMVKVRCKVNGQEVLERKIFVYEGRKF